tara:strand:+ start:1915 stop:2079 length:165 start_codon:yes stop_codon:yes gene_type:complete
MTVCPECKKQELENDEKKCPHCANKQTKKLVNSVFGVLAVIPLALIGLAKWKGK